MENDDIPVPYDNQEDNGDDEYHLGMLGGDEAWNGEWSSAKGDSGWVGDSVTAPPGGSPPGLLSPGQKPLVKDAVHEVEWDGQRWIAVHHSSSRSGTYNVSKLASTWKIAGTAPVYVDGQSEDGGFTMSYTLDKDPKSTGLTWWGTTYVKIEGREAPSANVNTPIVSSGAAYALVDSGASHVLMPLNSLSLKERTHAKDVSVNLAVGRDKQRSGGKRSMLRAVECQGFCLLDGSWTSLD
eukprot:681998-Amphidinium_carterae.2